MSEGGQWAVVCDAHRMTRSASDDWARFQNDTRPWDTLHPAEGIDDLDERARFTYSQRP